MQGDVARAPLTAGTGSVLHCTVQAVGLVGRLEPVWYKQVLEGGGCKEMGELAEFYLSYKLSGFNIVIASRTSTSGFNSTNVHSPTPV